MRSSLCSPLLAVPLLISLVPDAAARASAVLGPRRVMDWRPLAQLAPGRYGGAVTVKFVDGTGPVVRDGAVVDARGRVVLRLDDATWGAPVGRVDVAFGMEPKELRGYSDAAAAACRCDVADLSSYVRVQVGAREQDVPALMARLNALKDVEVAYPVHALAPLPVDLDPPTPDYAAQQTYRGPAPTGIGASEVHGQPGGDGAGLQLVDMEVDWTTTHEDLEPCEGHQVPASGTIYPGLDYQTYRAHGTAVLSILVAPDNGYGVTGLAPGLGCNYAPDYTQEWGESTARALVAAWREGVLNPGDVFLMESQTDGPDYNESTGEGLVPSEWAPEVADAIRALTAHGVIVVEAAGNGYANLDDAKYNNAFNPDMADSGAIVVGAGYPPGTGYPARSRTDFSNYGRRVNVQGWGWLVVSAGYGDLFTGGGDERQYYSEQFAGTSSASPIVTSSAALVQAMQKAGGGELLTPPEMRALLAQTGSDQAGNTGEHIGPLPNVPAAVAATRVCGNGRKDATEACEDGNTVSGDGCSADCTSTEVCGNGVKDAAKGEMCDDGNTVGGDGCSADCTSTEVCGNGVKDAAKGEVCDDGNTTAGDGCSADCKSTEVCGNGLVDAAKGEECDDGNTSDGDGCDSACKTETDDNSPFPVPPGCTSAGVPAAPLGLLLFLARRRRR